MALLKCKCGRWGEGGVCLACDSLDNEVRIAKVERLAETAQIGDRLGRTHQHQAETPAAYTKACSTCTNAVLPDRTGISPAPGSRMHIPSTLFYTVEQGEDVGQDMTGGAPGGSGDGRPG